MIIFSSKSNLIPLTKHLPLFENSELPQNIVDEKALDRSWFPEFLSQNDFCRLMLEVC